MHDSHRRARRAAAAIAVVGLGGALAAWWASTRSAAPEPGARPSPGVELTPNLALERVIAPGETHPYRLRVEKEHFLHLVVEQQGIDVATTVRDGSGKTVLVADRPIGDLGPEPFVTLVAANEPYSITVAAPGAAGPKGHYRLVVAELRPTTKRDRTQVEAAETFLAGEEQRRAGRFEQAVAQYDLALVRWRALGDDFWLAEVLDRLGQVHRAVEDCARGAELHQESAALARKAGDLQLEAMALTQSGAALFCLGEIGDAIDRWRSALPLRRQAGDRQGEAITLHDLGHAYHVTARLQDAIDHYSAALELWEKDAPGFALSQHNLGVLYHQLGRPRLALDHLELALSAWQEGGDRRREAAALSRTAEVLLTLGDADGALRQHGRALALRREVGDARGEATTLAGLAEVHEYQGETGEALNYYQQALVVLGDLDRPRSRARIHLRLGRLLNRLRRAEAALHSFREALATYRHTGDRTNEAESLLGIASAYRQMGDLRLALENTEPAIAILESVRPSAVSQELRADFFATVQHHFDSFVDLLMELERVEPGGGHLAAAFWASERSRARSLVDLLQEAGGDIRQGAEPALLVREREIQERINERERQRMALLREEDYSQRQVAAIERKLRELVRDLEGARAEIRSRSPRYAALTQPQPLTLKETQRQVVDTESLLLEYKLGRTASYLWLVSDREAYAFALPPRDEIEEVARQAYALLTRSLRWESRASTQTALCELSRKVLGPVSGILKRERLLIVSDGALDYIPFAVLPQPSALGDCHTAPSLVEKHEITYLPSASAAAVLRRAPSRQPKAAWSVAVVADPVFAPSDERLVPKAPAVGESPPETKSSDRSGVGPIPFVRLPFSRREADVILSLVPDGEPTLALLGLEANKDSVIGGVLSDFRIVHFATHGVLDAVQPELSGIALSMVDSRGRQRDGFLRAHEIYNLDLACDLVVLSACRTALGKEVRGEGLVGLTRGFMYAGASRVMVSLWSVSDRSTATLMEGFYRGLLERGLRPSAALREAQLAMSQQRKWSAPYHWAGFVLQGEWN